jgi:hypothetical protein
VIEAPGTFADADARSSAQAGDSLAVRRTAAAHCAMGVQVGFHGGSSWFRWPSSLVLAPEGLQTSSCLDGRQRFCTSEGIQPVRLLEINIGTVAYRAMWGYGVDPPADMNPRLGLVSRMSARSGRRCSRRRSWCSWLCTPASAPTEPAGSAGRGAGLCGTSCVSRPAQVMRPFDLSPSSGPFREVPERSTAGQQEADGTGAAPPGWKVVAGAGFEPT